MSIIVLTARRRLDLRFRLRTLMALVVICALAACWGPRVMRSVMLSAHRPDDSRQGSDGGYVSGVPQFRLLDDPAVR